MKMFGILIRAQIGQDVACTVFGRHTFRDVIETFGHLEDFSARCYAYGPQLCRIV